MCIGLGVFVLSLGLLFGADILGWVVTTAVWTMPAKALNPVSKAYKSLPGLVSLLGTYIFLLAILLAGAKALRANLKSFAKGFTGVFFISYACWFIGSYAYIAATPDKRAALKIPWSLNLTNESGFILALLAGLIVGNFLPGVAKSMKEAIRPELYIKTAIVILGGFLGIAALEQRALATSVIFRGACAIVEAYLIYWPIVYFVSRRYFGFSREWAAPLASGISICGVSAAIATGSAIKARPIVPIMVSSLVVIFAVVELMILPFAAQHWLYNQPMVAGAWMGLAVKTDGAAVASGAIADSLIRAKAMAATGVNYAPNWIMGVSTTVKVFIDIFIGVWAFILAWVWSAKIEHREGEKVKASAIWQRFPKFILGYVATFLIVLVIGVLAPALIPKIKASMGQANVLRALFFVLTFFAIGVLSNFRKLWEEGIAKLAGVYVLCLFGFIIWVGLLISWLFFAGVFPPIVKG
ncbi:MAG TPA: putative sulfate exporter family transporter [Terriglobales bacterium]|nr:putative sulfate exporter family transporter [Terriglobales bacterium]